MAPLLLNQPMYNAQTGRIVYQYPGAQKLSNQEVALVSMTYYNSFPNISAKLGNNVINFMIPSWPGGVYTPIYDSVTLKDGFYNISDINFALWNYFTTQGYYLYDPVSKNNVYFIQILTNSVTYSTQVNLFYLPNTTEFGILGWTNPSGVIVLNPASTGNCFATGSLTINAALGTTLGFVAQTLGPDAVPDWTLTPVSSLGTLAPAINPVTSLIVRCNLVCARIGQPIDMIAQVPLVSAFGSIDQFQAPYPVFSDVVNDTYATVEVYFMDQNYNIIYFYDPELTVTLELRDKPAKAPTAVQEPAIQVSPFSIAPSTVTAAAAPIAAVAPAQQGTIRPTEILTGLKRSRIGP